MLLIAMLIFGTATLTNAQDKKTKSIEGWGNVENRKKDCKFTTKDGSLSITVPGTPHNLNSQISDLNAPRVLKDVEGDFSIQVKVVGDFDPSPISTVAPRGKAYNGAGLLLWVDENLYVRLERNIWINGPADAQCHPPMFEVFVRQVPTGTSPPPAAASYFSTPATWFRMERSDGVISGFISQNGTDWKPCGTANLDLPKKLKIGVAAVNTSRKAFSVTFEDLEFTQK
jgi:regulation of enolase protein 1 (concanavalin A-like superfamily)